MVWLGLLGLILLLLVLRQSLVLVLAVATAYIHLFVAKSEIEFLIQDFWFTVDREVLLSIPLFMLAGNIMSRGSIAKRLIGFMSAFTSPFPGGLGIACVLSCAAFAAINGSSIVTMMAIGSVMYPALLARGYSQAFSLGAIASAGTLGHDPVEDQRDRRRDDDAQRARRGHRTQRVVLGVAPRDERRIHDRADRQHGHDRRAVDGGESRA